MTNEQMEIMKEDAYLVDSGILDAALERARQPEKEKGGVMVEHNGLNVNNLLTIIFNTEDADCPYHELKIVVVSSRFNINTRFEIEDSIASFLESDYGDMDYEDIVKTVMESSGLEWRFIEGEILACNASYTVWV